MDAEFAAWRFDADVDLSRRNTDAFGDELEVVDQTLHRLAHDVPDVVGRVAESVRSELQFRRPGDLAVLNHHRSGAEPVEALFDDLQRFAHLPDPDEIARVAVGSLGGDDVELVGLVAAVGFGAAQVVGQSGGPQDRSGDPEGHAAREIEAADVAGA